MTNTANRPSATGHVDELRARRAVRVVDRAQFEQRRRHGLMARHAAKLAHLAARAEEGTTEEQARPERPRVPDAA